MSPTLLLRLLLVNIGRGLTVDKARVATALFVAGWTGAARYALVTLIHERTGIDILGDDVEAKRLLWQRDGIRASNRRYGRPCG